MKKPVIVTSALPYANGPIHIGHLAGAYLPADIYVRFLRMLEEDVIYISGTDEHGAPITFQAEKRGVPPKAIVDEFHQMIHHSLTCVGIEFDFFGRTTTQKHYELTQEFFLTLQEQGFIDTKTEEHFYCSSTDQFLPDRYIEGECPYCGNTQARGDECSKCGKWLEADKLKNPHSASCPVDITKKPTKHWYLCLDKFQPQLEKWLDSKTEWKDNVIAFVKGWFKEGLKPRAITRDLRWGVPLPSNIAGGEGKVLYVWFDAPIGYLSMTQEWATQVAKNPDAWKHYWTNPDSQLVHFLGKDNIPFHTIVWPSMLLGQKISYVLPSQIPANEHLTLEGEKISSSKGNAVWIEEAVESFGVDYIRYYIAANSPENKDADFSWNQFATTINGDLVNTTGNLFQRLTSFIADRFDGIVPMAINITERDKQILTQVDNTLLEVQELFKQFRVKDVCKILIDLSREGNAYFQEYEPWKLINTDKERVGTICNLLIRLLEVNALLLYPIIPTSAQYLLQSLGYKQYHRPLLSEFSVLDPQGRIIKKQLPFFRRIDEKEILEQKAKLQERMDKIKKGEADMNTPPVEKKPDISIDQFGSISIQTARVLSVENVPKSKKLLKFQLDTEEGPRQILSGIATAYPDPQILVGKYIAFIANLPPRQMMGLESNGMILSAENAEGILEVVEVSEKVGKGANIK